MSVNASGLDEYNPFENSNDTEPIINRDSGHSVAAPIVSVPIAPPAYLDMQPSSDMSEFRQKQLADLERRQKELDAKAAELDRREKEQQARADTVAKARGSSSGEVANWPPLPSWCPCRPCVRQDFEADIPSHCRWMARYGYGFWVVYTLVLFLNVFASLAYFIKSDTGVEGPLFGASILVAVIMPVVTFFAWHRPLYKAFKKNSSLNYFLFFICLLIHCILISIQALGINYLGACGWINGLKMCGKDKGVCGFMIFIAICFTLAAVAGFYLLVRVHRFYRSSGANIAKAQEEARSGAVAAAVAAAASSGAGYGVSDL